MFFQLCIVVEALATKDRLQMQKEMKTARSEVGAVRRIAENVTARWWFFVTFAVCGRE